jgi:hypothetical protein
MLKREEWEQGLKQAYRRHLRVRRAKKEVRGMVQHSLNFKSSAIESSFFQTLSLFKAFQEICKTIEIGEISLLS